MGGRAVTVAARRKPAVFVFGEDDNDREAIRQLLLALRPDMPRVEKRRRPLVLVKGRAAAKQRRNAGDIATTVARESTRFDVRLVVAHQDADAVEPAHVAVAEAIETRLAAAGVRAVVAAVPAFEMEAWWFLWPDCALAVNGHWKRPKGRRDVGRIPNAKEALRRALRSQRDGKPTRDYVESDAPKIAAKVKEMKVVGLLAAQSRSFDRFAAKVKAVEL